MPRTSSTVRRFVLRSLLIATAALLGVAPAAHATGTGVRRAARPPVTLAAETVHTALELRGVPYVWGGTTPSGFDCSGFTRYVYGRAGIGLPHSSYAQWDAGLHVRKRNLRAGDLVFFGLGHVSLYLGGGRFIHAPETGRVVSVARLGWGWYAAAYSGAVRVPGSQRIAPLEPLARPVSGG